MGNKGRCTSQIWAHIFWKLKAREKHPRITNSIIIFFIPIICKALAMAITVFTGHRC